MYTRSQYLFNALLAIGVLIGFAYIGAFILGVIGCFIVWPRNAPCFYSSYSEYWKHRNDKVTVIKDTPTTIATSVATFVIAVGGYFLLLSISKF